MGDVIAGRIMVFIIGLAISIRIVRELSWENKFEKFFLRLCTVFVFLCVIADFMFEWLGLFPID